MSRRECSMLLAVSTTVTQLPQVGCRWRWGGCSNAHERLQTISSSMHERTQEFTRRASLASIVALPESIHTRANSSPQVRCITIDRPSPNTEIPFQSCNSIHRRNNPEQQEVFDISLTELDISTQILSRCSGPQKHLKTGRGKCGLSLSPCQGPKPRPSVAGAAGNITALDHFEVKLKAISRWTFTAVKST